MVAYTNPNWPTDPRAVTLLSDIAANPPRMKPQPALLSSIAAGGAETILVYDRNDDRVDELSRMSDAAFRYLLDFQGDYAAAKRVPKLDDVIAVAVAHGRRAAA